MFSQKVTEPAGNRATVPSLVIRPLQKEDLEKVRRFTDREIGEQYFSDAELLEIFAKSSQNGKMFSFVLVDGQGDIFGVRLTYPPGNWLKGKGKGLKPESWPHPIHETAYFQSIFMASSLSGHGWGGKMSLESLQCLRSAGASGVICHSWKESPNNSSFRYLSKLGFSLIAEYPDYWKDVDYNCIRCQRPPCRCTAQEMYLDLKGRKI